MRAAIRQILIDTIPQVGGRVYEPHVAGPEVDKPYLVVREGAQDPGADWSACSTVVEVWPYVDRTTFQAVDVLVGAIINTLHRARFGAGGEQYLVEYLGSTGQDFVDTEWDAITRGLRFQVFALGWLRGLTYDPDPVAALRAWTGREWPRGVYVDPAQWRPADAKPGVYWRLVGLAPVEQTAAVNWMEAQIRGHVLVPSTAVRLTWLRRVAEALARQRRLLMGDGGPLELLRVAADSEADPMRQGQIRLGARFGVLQPENDASVLMRGVVGGDVCGEVVQGGQGK